ncbi:hypothetical protein C2S52_007457 [Perilla frutescens var. hirtella]|nr:hypothetical protein C2S52_007457 [Perilla frutescens var. hirtella]
MASSKKLLPVFLFIIIIAISSPISTSAKTFSCSSSGATCHAIVDYVSPNATTLNAIKTLFTVRNLRSILGANSLPLNTPGRFPVAAKQTVKIPFPCICRNGAGISNGLPVYTVVPNDGLYHIAAEVFSNLVTYQEIQATNNISDANLIEVGQNLTIPLPCSCDDVGGQTVVHYGHVVAAGSSVEGIAGQYNISEETLLLRNNLTGPQALIAGDVIDIPLRACSSMVTNTSLDYPLLVPNNTYVVTANSCVKCKCDAQMNWMLHCDAAGINLSCPIIRCGGSDNLFLGNTTSSGCNATTCSYTGYNNTTIQTMVDSMSTCPAPTPNSSSTRLHGWRGNGLAIFIHAVMLCVLFLSSEMAM